MLVAALTFVSCSKDNDDSEPAGPSEPTWETPTVLTGTEWYYGDEATFSHTLIFVTETTGRKLTHNVIPGGETYDSERSFTYTYANGRGQYTTDNNVTYDFTVEGGKLTYEEYESIFEYNRKK